ncbi:hypothetical protein LOTGIDRAFT_228548 [Lottia gigantea]|uniref:Autophagy-related protein 13 n=1 Tax=Lottia gigantea TaxID=225164 RepID=V3ZQS6_LOTGI|nr:hypothetical protein LOTGIDRAFT_228548 [Lottia gigantea]ESO93773.1 hypothetical protein LOTGIDRAFT_228548 [Lottia gigantea]
MASNFGRISPQDRKDLEKFTNFFILKSLQIIVQSRLGEKIRTKSKPVSSGADWAYINTYESALKYFSTLWIFNLAVKDTPDVQTEAKKILNSQQSMLGQNVCAEISLQTSEGETMVLETWFMALDGSIVDNSVKVSYGVYNRMGIALKSLFSVSRIPPAYRLARQQGASGGDYVICYRFYLGEPQFFQLAEDYKKCVVGAVPTPMGKITINLAYRTKLLISPHKATRQLPFELKDDHFKVENSPNCPRRQTEPKPCSLGFRRTSVTEDIKIDELDHQDYCSTLFSTSPPDYAFITETKTSSCKTTPPISINHKQTLPPVDQRPQSAPENSNSFTTLHRVGAFVQPQSMKDLPLKGLEEIPFLSLLNDTGKIESRVVSGKDNCSTSSGENMETANSSTGTTTESEIMKSTGSHVSVNDDFVMVELKTPFAGVDSNNDLGKFFRDCQGALTMSMFEEETTLNDTLDQVTTQLAMFETNMKDFDDFVESFHQDMDP